VAETIHHLPYAIDEANVRNHFIETHWKRVALELLQRHCPAKGKTLLDYGCGRGEFVSLANEAGFQSTGADVDPNCVELTARRGQAVALQLGDPVQQFGARSFDVVACFHVLEHVDNPKLVLSGLGQIARQYLILAVPNLRQLVWLTHRNISLSLVNEGHLHSWDHHHFLNLAVRHCGLELVEWGFDATSLPLLSPLTGKIFGTKAQIALETGLFRRLLPFHGVSVLGLFRPKT
jgi:SAM-dependent methyltransferase